MNAITYKGHLIATDDQHIVTIARPDGSAANEKLAGNFKSITKAKAAINALIPKVTDITNNAENPVIKTTQKDTMSNKSKTPAKSTPMPEITQIHITAEMALKDVRAIAKSVPKKAKTMRYVIDGEKVARFDKGTNLEILHGLTAVVDFSSVPFAHVLKDNSKFETISLKQTTSKDGKGTKVSTPRPNTGFVALIDHLLLEQKSTLDQATKAVLEKFPAKDPKSVRRIVSNRVNARVRAAKDPKTGELPTDFVRYAWLPAQAKSGVMEAIDAHYFTKPATATFKEMVSDILERFPKMGNGDDREFEATSRIMRNRARILRKAGKEVNYIKSAVADAGEREAKKKAKEEAKATKAAERAAKTAAGKADAATEKAIASGKPTPAAKTAKPAGKK